MNSLDIIAICQILKSEGKEPSIALIKSRTDKNTPMPTLISGLQQWKANPTAEVKVSKSESCNTSVKLTLEERVVFLEQEVKKLTSLLLK